MKTKLETTSNKPEWIQRLLRNEKKRIRYYMKKHGVTEEQARAHYDDKAQWGEENMQTESEDFTNEDNY